MASLSIFILIFLFGRTVTLLLDDQDVTDKFTDDVLEDLAFTAIATSESILFTADKIRIRSCENEVIGWCSSDNDTDPAVHIVFSEAKVIKSLTLESTSVSCSRVQASSDMTRFELQYLDPAAELKSYDMNISGPRLGDGGRIFYDLSPTVYTRMLRISPSEPGRCFALSVTGSDGKDLCPDVTCQNGGRCSGKNECSCPKGFIGEMCETKVTAESIETNSFDFLAMNNGIISTPNADFNVTGIIRLESEIIRRFLNVRHAHRCVFSGTFSAIHQRFGHGHHHPWCVFHHINPFHGFTHLLQVSFGHHHNHGCHSYLFNYHPHSLHGASVDCYYSHGYLYYGVKHSNKHFHLKVSFSPRPNLGYYVTLSYGLPHGISLHVNGKLLGSQTRPNIIAPITTIPHHPGICMGICGIHTASPAQMIVSHVVSAGLHMVGLAVNGLTHLVSPFGASSTTNALSTQQLTTSSTQQPTTPSTLQPTTSSTLQSQTTRVHATATTAHANGPLCYSCIHQATDGACKTILRCKTNEVCTLYKDFNGFTHKCLDQQVCSQAKQLTGAICWICCSGSLCNDRCSSGPKPCFDKPTCSVLQSTGFNVCSNPTLAAAHCKKSCHIC